jgi:hypothetical protein
MLMETGGTNGRVGVGVAVRNEGKASAAARELVACLGTTEAKKALSANGVE